MPTKILFGEGALSRLKEVLPSERGRVMVVSGVGSLRSNGTLDRVAEALDSDTVFYEGISANPAPDHIDRAVRACRDERCEIVVGIGGGSVLDAAKSVSILQPHTGSTMEYATRQLAFVKPSLPCIAIPTTAGTGSEVTPWASVWDPETNRKFSLDNPRMFPVAAIVDPELTWSLPRATTAATGIDALTQAIEAFWSKSAQPVSDLYALQAVRIIVSSLEGACDDGDPHSRNAMARAALLAGLAFSNTRTTICHSLSYPMTTRFGIVHGQAVSITLPAFLQWNADVLEEKLPALLEAIGVATLEAAVQRISALMANVGLATSFSELGVSSEDLDVIAAEGYYPERDDNNPKPYSRTGVRSLLESVL